MKKISAIILAIVLMIPSMLYFKNVYIANSDSMKFIKGITAIDNYFEELDYNLYGGVLSKDRNVMIELLQNHEITTRTELMETIDFFAYTGGYSLDFMKLYQDYVARNQAWQNYLEVSIKSEEEKQTVIKSFENYTNNYTNEALYAYDYTCAMSYVVWGYAVGALSFNEAKQLCVEYAEKLQEYFSTWQEYQKNYILAIGFIYSDEPDDITAIEAYYNRAFLEIGNAKTGYFKVPFDVEININEIKQNQTGYAKECVNKPALVVQMIGIYLLMLIIAFIIIKIAKKLQNKLGLQV